MARVTPTLEGAYLERTEKTLICLIFYARSYCSSFEAVQDYSKHQHGSISFAWYRLTSWLWKYHNSVKIYSIFASSPFEILFTVQFWVKK